MATWLMKSEPFKYSWQQLVKDKKTNWDGVRNHLAKKHLQAMQVGDEAFFYHSNEGLEIVGIMRIVRTAHPDPSDPTGKFVQVTVEPVRALPQPVSLKTIKTIPELADMPLVTLMRLSVQPVSAVQWRKVCALGGVSL